MRRVFVFALWMWVACGAFAAGPALTIYNQNFAVVRQTVPLDLKAGVTDAQFDGVTAQLEPDSVILRDPAGKVSLNIQEQSYRNDPVSQGLLLSLFEGKTIRFFVKEPQKPDAMVDGKIVRSGYGVGEPIIEVNGEIIFGLPGQPLFPSLGDGTILKPRLSWKIESDAAAKVDAELAYVTGGMSWEADYNIVAPENGDALDITGWVTVKNESGTGFEDAKIKLIAGDVNKIQPAPREEMRAMDAIAASAGAPQVTEKAFEDFHLYTLPRPVTLRDRETKQVEFIHASGVKAERVYIYDGTNLDWGSFRGQFFGAAPEFGAGGNTKVAIRRDFKNSEENHLGIALPKGRLRFYKQDDDGQLEFTGENTIDYTAKDETLKIYTGNAFDIVGERKRTLFQVNQAEHWANEAFEIKLRNHKKEAVEVRVVEHLPRWENWTIAQKSDAFTKTDAQTVEFRVPVKPDEEKVVTYEAHYTW